MIDPLRELYRRAHQLTGGMSTLLEWDANIPPFPVVHAEVRKARQYMTADGLPDRSRLTPPADVSPGDPSGGVPHPLHFIAADVT